jgi:snRNA-activating protein complex subunit 1
MLNVHDHYQNMKHAISADKSMPDRALSLVKEDFFENIKNIVLEHQEWHKERKVSACLLLPPPGPLC